MEAVWRRALVKSQTSQDQRLAVCPGWSHALVSMQAAPALGSALFARAVPFIVGTTQHGRCHDMQRLGCDKYT